MSESIIAGAVTVAVTSGKGGIGKTTTAVALAAALASRDIDVILIDGDLDGPNVHLVAEVDEPALGVDKQQLSLRLPTSPYGFRVVTPHSITSTDPAARVSATDLIGMAQFADAAQVVIVDLPPGWTEHHDNFCHTMPDLVLAVVAPTATSISDHGRHLRAWERAWTATVKAREDKDRRRKLNLPVAPRVVAVETMARFTGIPENGGDPVTIRRIDAVAASKVDELVAPVLSVPSAATLRDSAQGPEMGKLADMVIELLGT